MILTTTAVALLGATGCASSGSSTTVTAEAAPTVAASQGASKIIDTYQKYMTAYVTAYHDRNPDYGPFVSLGGGNGGGLQASLRSALDNGLTAAGKPSWSQPVVQFVNANDSIASVSFCFNPGTWKTVMAKTVSNPKGTFPPLSGTVHPPHPAYPGDAVGKYIVLMLLHKDTSGNWFVDRSNAETGHPC
jgi:hypothetical protein